MPAVCLLHSAVELSSASEDDMDSEDSEPGEKGQACSHCLTTSKYITSISTSWWCILHHVTVDSADCYFLIVALEGIDVYNGMFILHQKQFRSGAFFFGYVRYSRLSYLYALCKWCVSSVSHTFICENVNIYVVRCAYICSRLWNIPENYAFLLFSAKVGVSPNNKISSEGEMMQDMKFVYLLLVASFCFTLTYLVEL